MTYTENISRADHIANKYHDKTKDYYKKTKEVLGIDMTLSSVVKFKVVVGLAGSRLKIFFQ